MCNCLQSIKSKLVEIHGPTVELELVPTFDFKTGETGAEIQPLYFRFEEGKNRRRLYIPFAFCPFCGRRKE